MPEMTATGESCQCASATAPAASSAIPRASGHLDPRRAPSTPASGPAKNWTSAAGAYQLTPWKGACLTQCRSPLGFLMTSWRDGPALIRRRFADTGSKTRKRLIAFARGSLQPWLRGQVAANNPTAAQGGVACQRNSGKQGP